jgi:hypothetical protein
MLPYILQSQYLTKTVETAAQPVVLLPYPNTEAPVTAHILSLFMSQAL